MSYSETSNTSQRGFWPRIGSRLPLKRNLGIGLAAVAAVAVAVLLTWMLAAGPWSGDESSSATDESGGFDGGGVPSIAPSPSGSSGSFGSSTMALTVTGDSEDSFRLSKGEAAAPASESAGGGTVSVMNAAADRQIISQGSMSVQVQNVPAASAQVRAIAEGVGGFVEQLSSFGVDEFQETTMSVRVPQDEFFSVFEQIKSLGKVQSENAGSEDVTERFIDLEARLKSSQREEESLLSLLDRANQVSEILTIERELARVRTELEQVQGQLNFLERRVDLATITVFLSPPQQDEAKAPSGSLSIETSDVGGSVNSVKSVVSQAGGEIDQVYTSIQDGRERTVMTVRVFSDDFNFLVSAVESQGGLVFKEIREGQEGDVVSPLTDSDEPNARLEIELQEPESSDLGRDLAIYTPIGSVALVVVLGLLLYGAFRMGQRHED